MKDEKKIDNKNVIVKDEETASKMKSNEQAKAEAKAETVAEEEKNTGEPERKIRTVH